jgi:uncharacterized repeat protein (TIGR01451 family)
MHGRRLVFAARPLPLAARTGATALLLALALQVDAGDDRRAPSASPTRRTDTFPFTLPAGYQGSMYLGPVIAGNGALDISMDFPSAFTILACVGPSGWCRPMFGKPGHQAFTIPSDFPAGPLWARVYFNYNYPQPPGKASGTVTFTYYPPTTSDLTVTKTDGVAGVTPGQVVTYTIQAGNAGPDPVTDAWVVDAFPYSLNGINWTCSASAGSSCASPSGSGNISQRVSLLVGGNVTFRAAGTLNVAATGSLVNSARITTPDPGNGCVDPYTANNTATDTDALLMPADLSVTKSDGQAAAVPGQAITYTITASNAGPNPVSGVTVSDPVPASLLSTTWTCVATGGASCTASGSGNISDTVNLPVGGTATYTLSGTLSSNPPGLSNTATVTLPAGFGDPTPADDSATDTDAIVYPATELFTVTPCRVVDTRWPAGPQGGPALVASSTRTFPVAGICDIPSTATAVSVNVTVVGAAARGYLTLYRSDLDTAPLVSTINFTAGVTRANNAVVPLAVNGAITAKNGSAGGVDFVLDVNGYFQ